MSNLSEVRNDEVVVSEINTIESEIKIIKAQTSKFLLNSAMQIGKRLKEAKALVGHGNWEKWLEEKVEYSQRTATNLMRLYDEYGTKLDENSNRNIVANLGYSQAIAMLKLDFEEREELMIEHDVTEMKVQELKTAIEEKLAIKQEKEALEEKYKALENKESEMAEELKEKINAIKEYDQLVKEKATEVKELREKLESIEESDDDPMVSESIKNELERKKAALKLQQDEIILLKQQLEEKPKEVEVKQICYEVPEETTNYINTLESKLKSSEAAVEFKATFNVLINIFNELLEKLSNIKNQNSEEYEKYKNAVNKLLEQLAIVE